MTEFSDCYKVYKDLREVPNYLRRMAGHALDHERGRKGTYAITVSVTDGKVTEIVVTDTDKLVGIDIALAESLEPDLHPETRTKFSDELMEELNKPAPEKKKSRHVFDISPDANSP